jgi:hypothetical protein
VLVEQLTQHTTRATNARTAKSIEAHVNAFSAIIFQVVNPW